MQPSDLFREVRCPVCDGQSIADSNTDEALYLKEYIREKFQEGLSMDAIRLSLRHDFGDEILFLPPFNLHTAFLWGFPLFLVLCFVCFAVKRFRTSKADTEFS